MDIKNVFTQVFILFILILVGYIATKKNLIDSSLTKKLSKLIMNIFLPCMIINSMQLEYSPTVLKKVLLLILISLFIYAISFLIAIIFKAISKSKNDIVVYQFDILFSNHRNSKVFLVCHCFICYNINRKGAIAHKVVDLPVDISSPYLVKVQGELIYFRLYFLSM